MDRNNLDPEPEPRAGRRFSRRHALHQGGTGLAAAALTTVGVARTTATATAAAQDATPVVDAGALPAEIRAIIEAPRYRFARWGIHVADRATGEIIHDLAGGQRFLAASTTKLFSGSAALDAYGPDHQFETPVYRQGDITAAGELRGDLVLVASGDLTMGGRDTPDGHIAFTPIDHINANALPLATLTTEDPLAGLDDLARQVAAAGIRHVARDVMVDARLFPAMEKDDYILTPIWINDNLIDLTITPGDVGAAATIDWRPQTAAYEVQGEVQTVAAGEVLDVSVTSPRPGQITVAGQIPIDQTQLVRTHQVEDPPALARTLLIEALGRQGVTVAAAPTGANPAEQLPTEGSYTPANRVAVHRSLPFSENITLIQKTSHNQHADMLIFLLALQHGETSFEAGMTQIHAFLERIGLDPAEVSLSDGRGNEYTDLFSPRTVSDLLRALATRPEFPVFVDALPSLGVDGTETETVSPTSPVRGKAVAKSGTTVAGDLMNQRPLLMTRAIAGYVTASSGRELTFAVYVNDVPLVELVDDIFAIIKEQGTIIEAIYAQH